MIKNTFKSEIITSFVLILILLTFIRPSDLLMPQSIEMMLPIFLVASVLIFLSLFWKEKSKDERENLHRLSSGRISFMVGSAILTIGIISQSLSHNLDPWLVVTLVLMILTKVSSRIYNQIKN